MRFWLHLGIQALCLTALVTAGATARAADTISLSLNIKDGATISDIVRVKAEAYYSQGINKVDFLVDNQLRHTDSSVPYTFDWNTLDDSEGPHTLTAVATDVNGNTKSVTIHVVINNELGKGAAYYADLTVAGIKANNLPAAENMARRALKIDPTNLKVKSALASLDEANHEYGKALDELKGAAIPSDDYKTKRQLASLYIMAGRTASSTSDFLSNAQTALDLEKQALQTEVNSALHSPNAQSAEGQMAVGDAYFYSQQYDKAVQIYEQCADRSQAPLPCVNRLVLANYRDGHLRAATYRLDQLRRDKREDTVTKAIRGMVLIYQHDFKGALQEVAAGAADNNLASIMISAYAHSATGKADLAEKEAKQAAALAPNLPEVQYLLSLTAQGSLDSRDAFFKAVAADPSFASAYAMRGFQTLLAGGHESLQPAMQFFNFALKIEPINQYALIGKAIDDLMLKQYDDAGSTLDQLLKLNPNAPDSWVVDAAYDLYSNQSSLYTQKAMEKAFKLDPNYWGDTFVPHLFDLAKRVYVYRALPILTPNSLYPPAASPVPLSAPNQQNGSGN